MSAVPAVELHPLHQEHVLSPLELLVVVAEAVHVFKARILDSLFIRPQAVDVLQFVYKAVPMI